MSRPVLALNPHRLCDIEQNVHLIGAALGVSAPANRLAIGFATELARLRVPRAAGTHPAIFLRSGQIPRLEVSVGSETSLIT